MNELAGFGDILKILGTSGVVFVMWYLYHKETVKQLNTVIANHFKLITDLVDTLNLHNGLLQKMIEKIDTNQWCPYVRQVQKRGDNEPA